MQNIINDGVVYNLEYKNCFMNWLTKQRDIASPYSAHLKYDCLYILKCYTARLLNPGRLLTVRHVRHYMKFFKNYVWRGWRILMERV